MDTIQDRRLHEAYEKLSRALARREKSLADLVRIELAIKQARKEVRRKELRVAASRPVGEHDPKAPTSFYAECYPFRHDKIDAGVPNDGLDDI